MEIARMVIAPMIHQAGPEGGFAEMMGRLAKSFVGPSPVTLLGASHYYAVDFADSVAAREGATANGVGTSIAAGAPA